MKRAVKVVVLLFAILCGREASAQNSSTYTIPEKVTIEGETFENYTIPQLYIFPWQKFDRPRDEAKYRKLIYNLRRVYPYAIMARDMLISMEADMAEMKSQKERDIYIKSAEKRLRKEFEEPLKHLSISQGKLLLKLIDRETGRTSYSIVKDLRGSFSAFFWQSLARLFGSNLKSTFDAEGEDKYLNRLIIMYENNQLYDI